MSSFVCNRRALTSVRSLFVGLVVVMVAAVFFTSAGSGGGASPQIGAATPTSRGQALVQRFFTLLQNQDRQGLRAFLAPNFQSVRANGGVQEKPAYLIDLPKIGRFKISNVRGTQSNDVLVVSYQLTVREKIGGVEQPGSPAPRLSVFHREKGAWHLSAHANFGAINK